MKSVSLVVLGVLVGLGLAYGATVLMERGNASYGVIERDVAVCEIIDPPCAAGENLGALSAGTPFVLRSDSVLEIRIDVHRARGAGIFKFDEGAAKVASERLLIP